MPLLFQGWFSSESTPMPVACTAQYTPSAWLQLFSLCAQTLGKHMLEQLPCRKVVKERGCIWRCHMLQDTQPEVSSPFLHYPMMEIKSACAFYRMLARYVSIETQLTSHSRHKKGHQKVFHNLYRAWSTWFP